MKLDFNPSNGAYILEVNRGEHDVISIMEKHGLDFSTPASSPSTGVLFTREMYAALPFYKYATDRAITQLGVRAKEIAASWGEESDANISTPDGFDLKPYQKAGVEYCMRRNGALIGDQPGLGKTMMAIAMANEMGAKKVLVIVPAGLRIQWSYDIRDWSVMHRPIIYPILKSADGVNPHAQWTILSYDLTRSEGIFEALKRGKYDLVILDEAHYLKNNEAQRTQQVFGENGLRNECGYVLSLTGTPLPNRPRECYTIARGTCWDSIDWQTEEEFRDKYNPSHFNGRYAREVAGRTPELNARLRSHFMVRRLKRDVQSQLPKVTHEITHIEPDGAIRKALVAEAMLDLSAEMINKGTIPPGMISTVRKEMGVALASHIADYVNVIMDGGEQKVFLAGWHKDVLDIWEKTLHKRGTVRVDGKTTPTRKQLAINKFISDPECRVFIGNLLSAGVGLDGLQKVCSRVIIGEPDWVPGNNEQVVSRLDRIGQELPVLANYMVAPGSLSERVLSSSLEKMQDIHAALDEEI